MNIVAVKEVDKVRLSVVEAIKQIWGFIVVCTNYKIAQVLASVSIYVGDRKFLGIILHTKLCPATTMSQLSISRKVPGDQPEKAL